MVTSSRDKRVAWNNTDDGGHRLHIHRQNNINRLCQQHRYQNYKPLLFTVSLHPSKDRRLPFVNPQKGYRPNTVRPIPLISTPLPFVFPTIQWILLPVFPSSVSITGTYLLRSTPVNELQSHTLPSHLTTNLAPIGVTAYF